MLLRLLVIFIAISCASQISFARHSPNPLPATFVDSAPLPRNPFVKIFLISSSSQNGPSEVTETYKLLCSSLNATFTSLPIGAYLTAFSRMINGKESKVWYTRYSKVLWPCKLIVTFFPYNL